MKQTKPKKKKKKKKHPKRPPQGDLTGAKIQDVIDGLLLAAAVPPGMARRQELDSRCLGTQGPGHLRFVALTPKKKT